MEATGIIFTVLDEISYKLNFTYNIREPDDGSYAGMIQKVVLKLVAFIIAQIQRKGDEQGGDAGGRCFCHQ